MTSPLITFLILLCSSSPAVAQQATNGDAQGADNVQATEPAPKPPAGSRDDKVIERITVVGHAGEVADVPGSAAVLEGEQLDEAKTGVADIGRALRQIPGVTVIEEDAYGLRPNIGMRGAPSERSSSITLMEDGILAAPAPYSAPAAYYFPTFGRMSGMEVTKGAGQIKYGPRTTGGSLNLLSTAIPEQFALKGDIATGMYDTTRGHLSLGESFTYGGYMLETYQMNTSGFKDLDNGGDTGFNTQDYLGKVRFNTSRDADTYQQIEFKVGYYDQDSNETYLGLSREDFKRTPNRRYAASQLDKVTINQQQYQAQHYIELSDSTDLTTTGYYHGIGRRWNKLDSVNGESLSSVLDDPSASPEAYDWLRGSNSPADALSMRDADRDYYAAGVQSVLVHNISSASLGNHRIETGFRYHEDQEDRKQRDNKYQMLSGTMVQTSAGVPLSQTNRISSADAIAVYMQDTITAGAWRFVPGVRYETIQLHRKDYGKNDPTRSGFELKENNDSVDAIIPGIGTEYSFTDAVSGFAGIHKGFSPPGPSDKDGVKEEESIAYELGTNIKRGSLLSQFTLFANDYDNLLGQDTLSSGGSGTGDQFNLGEALAYGVEASMQYDLRDTFNTSFGLPVYATYTYTDAEFRSNFTSDVYGDVKSGDPIPYIPKNQFALGVGIDHERYGKLLLRSHYVQAMDTQPDSTSGLAPKTDSYFVMDARVESPEIKKGVRLYVDVTNIFDQEYIVAWRPAGARPGMPVTALGGIKVDL